MEGRACPKLDCLAPRIASPLLHLLVGKTVIPKTVMKTQNPYPSISTFAKALAVILVAGSPTIASAQTIDLGKPLPESLKPDILYFNFDEVQGTAVSSGILGGIDATIEAGTVTAPPTPADGLSIWFKKAMEFNYGAPEASPEVPNATIQGNYVKVPTAPELNLEGQSFTMGAWVKVLAEGNDLPENSTKYILGKGGYNKDVPGWAFVLQKRSANRWVLLFQHSSGQGAETESAVVGWMKSFTTDVWHHIALSYNHEANTLLFYLDGISIDPSPFEPFRIGASTNLLLVGERGVAHYGTMRVAMDEVFIVSGVHELVPPAL